MSITILTTIQFNKQLKNAVDTGVKSRDAFKALAEDAVAFMLADGPSRNDTGRLTALLYAAAQVKATNTTALASWIRKYAPVTIIESKEYPGVFIAKYSKMAGNAFKYDAVEYLTVPFWTHRAKTEQAGKAIVLDKAVHSFLARILRAGVSIHQLEEAMRLELAKVQTNTDNQAIAE